MLSDRLRLISAGNLEKDTNKKGGKTHINARMMSLRRRYLICRLIRVHIRTKIEQAANVTAS
jgi:hypothetical protein